MTELLILLAVTVVLLLLLIKGVIKTFKRQPVIAIRFKKVTSWGIR